MSLFDSDSSIKVDGVRLQVAAGLGSADSRSQWVRTRLVQRAGGVLAAGVAVVLLIWISSLNPAHHRSVAIDDESQPKPGQFSMLDPGSNLKQLPPEPTILARANDPGSYTPAEAKTADQSPLPESSHSYLGLRRLSDLTPAVYQLPSTIQSLEPYYNYTSELPGVKPWASGINQAAQLIRESMLGESKEPPKSKGKDFGRRLGPLQWSLASFA